jgi:hypothetical protein
MFVPQETPPRPVTGMALFLYADMFVPHRKHLRASTACYGERVTFLYIDDVRTSQEPQASTVCYRDGVTFLYVDVRTSQEAPTSTVCYGDRFTFLFQWHSLHVVE